MGRSNLSCLIFLYLSFSSYHIYKTPAKMSSDPIVQQLLNFTACDVSDALLKLKHPHGGFLSGISLWSPERQVGNTKIVGKAYTVRYVLNSDTEAPTFEDGHYVS